MPNLEKASKVLDKALAEWRKQETLKKGKISISRFANFLEYSPALVGFWLNGDRPISEDALINIAPKLANLLGVEIYDELGIPRPDKIYEYVADNWNDAPLEEQERIAKIISKYSKKPLPNENQKNSPSKI